MALPRRWAMALKAAAFIASSPSSCARCWCKPCDSACEHKRSLFDEHMGVPVQCCPFVLQGGDFTGDNGTGVCLLPALQRAHHNWQAMCSHAAANAAAVAGAQAGAASTEQSSQMRTSLYTTPALGSCPWPTAGQIPTAASEPDVPLVKQS